MSNLLTIDTGDVEKLLEKKVFDPIPPAVYICEIANSLAVSDSKSSDNKIVKVELRVVDEGEYKGRVIFDNLIIGSTPEAKKKSEWKIAQFAIACGVCTKETLANIDLDMFKGTTCSVKIGQKTEMYNGEQRTKNVVQQYMFETE